jgi:hypothetical protein
MACRLYEFPAQIVEILRKSSEQQRSSFVGPLANLTFHRKGQVYGQSPSVDLIALPHLSHPPETLYTSSQL